ncbi:YitT family protein [Paenibacillus doosanensis]|uniref:YitT family protein n=1 Tax=Paenibacillus doosanensis TaxID=1229154 RepID=UPI0021802F58|nr:YitT family protein [Paenibacillus doosanensis]MCS7460157.1 YitT family protein [Paenibacillus doosanensis]
MVYQWVRSVIIVILGSALVSVSFNMFLIPHQLLSGGLSGISMIIGYFTGWNIALLYFIFNLPVIVWGLMLIGRKFIVLSVVSVIMTTWFMDIFPHRPLAQNEILAAVTGGVLIGIGTGISMRAGGSTGGFDIIGSIITQKRDFPLGTALFVLNGIVIVTLGYYKDNWDLALFSMLSIFITGKVLDTIHTRHLKVTVFIVTRHTEALLEELLKIQRGVTVLSTEGAYTKHPQKMLMTVTTRYELEELRHLILRTAPDAFVNIVETIGIMGQFRRG